jgi:hypothetical protein
MKEDEEGAMKNEAEWFFKERIPFLFSKIVGLLEHCQSQFEQLVAQSKIKDSY